MSELGFDDALLEKWRQQIGRQLRRRMMAGARDLAVVAFQAKGPVHKGLVSLRNLTACVIHDEPTPWGPPNIRFAATKVGRIDWGVMIGGAGRIWLERNLTLMPSGSPSDSTSAFTNPAWLRTALQMDRCLARHARVGYLPHPRKLRLPRFWAALNSDPIIGNGPEFQDVCEKYRLPADVALMSCARRFRGRRIYPLEFVSDAWQQIVSIYADLRSVPNWQVIQLRRGRTLLGFQGAVQFDLNSYEIDVARGRLAHPELLPSASHASVGPELVCGCKQFFDPNGIDRDRSASF